MHIITPLISEAETERGRAYEKAQQQGKRSPCLAGTRTEVFSRLGMWVADPDDYRVFWLNGMAGTGKSTIADSLTRYAKSKGVLGAVTSALVTCKVLGTSTPFSLPLLSRWPITIRDTAYN